MLDAQSPRPLRLPTLRRLSFPFPFALVILSLLIQAFVTTSASAATRTWTGAGANDLWSTPANWAGNVAPSADDSIVFPTGAMRTVNVNDLPAGTGFTAITFAAAYTISGNPIVLTASIGTSGLQTATVGLNITLNGASPIEVAVAPNGTLALTGVLSGATGIHKDGTGTLRLAGANTFTGLLRVNEGVVVAASPQAFGSPATGTIVYGTSVVEMQSSVASEPLTIEHAGEALGLRCNTAGVHTWGGTIQVDALGWFVASNTCDLRLSGAIIGSAGVRLTMNSGGVVQFAGGNTYLGLTQVWSGTLTLGAAGALPATTLLQISDGTVVDLNGFSQTVRGASGAGSLLLNDATLTVDIPTESLVGYTGSISGNGGIVKKGIGAWGLGGAQTYTGTSLVNDGWLVIHGTLVSPILLQGGTLNGDGQVATIAGSSGHLNPTYVGDPSMLSSHSVTLTPDIEAAFSIDGPVAGTQYSQLRVTGTVTLGNAPLTLSIATGFATAGAPELVLIDNDGTDPIVGTFAGLPEGSLIAQNGKTFRLSYAGGTGNDVTLTPMQTVYYLSEGATGPFFDTDLLLANPNDQPAPIVITFLRDDGESFEQTLTLAPTSRRTIRVDELSGLEAATFSTIVDSTSSQPIIVERTMRWGASGYGAHTEKASGGLSRTWLFAEGAEGFFSTFLLLNNPGDAAGTATVTYLREKEPALVRTYPMPARARKTIDIAEDEELRTRSFGMAVELDFQGSAERAMYFGANPFWTGGAASAGETRASETWYFAEGATGSFFTTFILLANQASDETTGTITYLPAGGTPVSKPFSLEGHGRLTLNVAEQDPSLANASVATQVTAHRAIIAERAQYWPGGADTWYESHNSFGVTALGTKWGLAEGRVGGTNGYQTYILLGNPNSQAAQVTMVFMREDGTTVSKPFTVDPKSRFSVSVGKGSLVPEITDESFGTLITSDTPIVVERAMYWDANGQTWSAGTNATATRLP